MDTGQIQPSNALRKLYPEIDDAAAEKADEALADYVALALRVFERLESDTSVWAAFDALTAARGNPTMKLKAPQPPPPQSP